MNKIFADFQFDTFDCFDTHRKLAWIWDPNMLRVCVCVTRKKIYLFVHLINSLVNRLVPLRLYIVRIEWIAGSCRFLIYERTSVFMDFHSVPWPHSMSAFIYLLSVCLCRLSALRVCVCVCCALVIHALVFHFEGCYICISLSHCMLRNNWTFNCCKANIEPNRSLRTIDLLI